MSFEPNDKNKTIHSGNYEEFFILYMDNELSGEQKKMVDSFLLAHPDLQGELDILMSTKLPLEEFNFNKEELFASNMKLFSFDEELLLYIDNELPADKKNIVELELASNKNYRLQHNDLLQARLDPSEKIVYPNKEELYRRTERVVYFKPWMRVAAAAMIIAIGGMFYFKNSSSTTVDATQNSQITASKPPVKQNEIKGDTNREHPASEKNSNRNELVNANTSPADRKNVEKKQTNFESSNTENTTAYNKLVIPETVIPEKTIERTSFIEAGTESGNKLDPKSSVANALNKDIVNANSVTSSLLERNTIEPPVDQKGLTAGSNLKGSVKGFLRRATRVIEKRTGFDPTNDNGQLLIGSVAINLK